MRNIVGSEMKWVSVCRKKPPKDVNLLICTFKEEEMDFFVAEYCKTEGFWKQNHEFSGQCKLLIRTLRPIFDEDMWCLIQNPDV